MDRNRLEPIGIPDTDYGLGRSCRRPPQESPPNILDRWLLDKLREQFRELQVHIALWDEPEGKHQEVPTTVRFCDRGAMLRVMLNPAFQFGNMYSTGRVRVSGDFLNLIDGAFRYLSGEEYSLTRRAWRGKPVKPDLLDSRNNIHHHYDIGNDFYRLWLDTEALQYTCAYYANQEMSLEQAQQAKMAHVCRKLRLQPGENVVEAGSGWGGFALYMARHHGVKVRSFNISEEQIAYSREWARREQLTDRVEFIEDDFRNIQGTCDAFVSIGMLEHVGPGNYEDLGRLISRILTPEGRGLIHSIGRDRPQPLNGWIDKYIFPGAYPPTIREMMDLFESSGLSVLDLENIRLHYAQTLRDWLERFEDKVDTVRNMFDEAFVRAWRLYLAGSIMAFLHGRLQLFQVLFSRSGMNNIPWTRDYIYRGDE